MEISIKWTLCRTCTNSGGGKLQSIFDDDNLVKQLKEYAGLNIKQKDGLPDQICSQCVENLQLAHTFLNGCKRADYQLRNVVRRTMSPRKSFASPLLEADIERQKLKTDQDREEYLQSKDDSSRASDDTANCVDSVDYALGLMGSSANSMLCEKVQNDYIVIVNEADDNECNDYTMSDLVNDDCEIEIIKPEFNLSVPNTLVELPLQKTTVDESDRLRNDLKVTPSVAHSIDLRAACEPESLLKHTCFICSNSFPNATQLKSHMRTHGNAKAYECELCSKRFNAACNLTTHIRTHTGEKPFKCEHCGRRFADRSTHRKHERMHTNERPYTCKICNNSFALSTTLKAHSLLHSKEKPHKCVTCNKEFRLPHQLKAHKKTHAHRYEVGLTRLSNAEGVEYSRS